MSFVERHLLRNSSLKLPSKNVRGALYYTHYIDNADDQTADFAVSVEIIKNKKNTQVCIKYGGEGILLYPTMPSESK